MRGRGGGSDEGEGEGWWEGRRKNDDVTVSRFANGSYIVREGHSEVKSYI